MRDLPEWLEEFTDNLEDAETPVPAHVSQDSDSERPTKVVSTSMKYSIFAHFQKDRNCEVCLRTKITKSLCRRRTGEAVPRAEKFGDLITADHEVFNEEGESRNNHRFPVVVQDLATQWNQSYPCRTKTSQETEKSSKKLLEPSQKPRLKHRQLLENLEHLLNNYHGITERLHLIDPRQTELPTEQYEE